MSPRLFPMYLSLSCRLYRFFIQFSFRTNLHDITVSPYHFQLLRFYIFFVSLSIALVTIFMLLKFPTTFSSLTFFFILCSIYSSPTYLHLRAPSLHFRSGSSSLLSHKLIHTLPPAGISVPLQPFHFPYPTSAPFSFFFFLSP